MATPLTAPMAPLRLAPELAEKLRRAAFDGLQSLPRGGELAGLITAAPSLPSFAVDLSLVRFEHRFGLSEEDIRRFRDAAGRCRKERKPIAAYFRSSARSNGVVGPEDRLAIAEVCPEAVFAVIARPTATGSAHVRIFRAVTDDQWIVLRELTIPAPISVVPSNGVGTMQPQETLRALEEAAPPRVREDLPPPRLIKEPAAPRIIEEPPAPRIIEDPAPQRVSEVAVLPSVVNDAAPPLSPAAPDIPKVEASSNESAPPAQSPARPFLRHGSLKAILPFVAVFMLASLVVVVVRIGARRTSGQAVSGPHPPAKPAVSASAQTGLGLAVRQEAGQLHLTWSRDSFAAKAATSGTLQIQDGASPVSIRLAVSDLTEGSIVYTPHSQDVTFQLRLGESPGPSAEETIRVIGAAQAAVTATPIDAAKSPADSARAETRQKRPPPPQVISSALPATSSQPGPSPAVVAKDNAPPPSMTPAANPQSAPAPSPQSQPPQSKPAQAQTVQAQTAQIQPAQTTPLSETRQNSLPASGEPVASRPPQLTAPPRPEPAPAATTDSVPGIPPAASRTAAAAAAGSGVAYPIPIRRVEPSLAGTRWKVLGTTRVTVLVSVNAKGFVTDAQPAEKGASLYLAGLCLTAARQWTFKPASVNGKPVAGKYQIEFVFRPQ